MSHWSVQEKEGMWKILGEGTTEVMGLTAFIFLLKGTCLKLCSPCMVSVYE